ncbi:MAG: GSCFA domain-containing protein [Bacteroidales bacterium]|nr:GSCFA domain-containing protein [Bacteroidales bacterium]
MKLFTRVEPGTSSVEISYNDNVFVLGSCFADSVGMRLLNSGFNVCVNPFGTLYNPLSIAKAIDRLDSGKPFTKDECVRMGAGADLVCSFSHHTSFARADEADFLAGANACLQDAALRWKTCNKVIISLGTVWCYFHDGEVVSNCLKRPQAEFERKALSLAQTSAALRGIIESNPGKEFIFTVSPIRHLADGAHANQLSKSTLLLAVQDVLGPGREYFPAYEILMDELRDYRFYAEDLSHPSHVAEEYIWENFISFAVPEDQRARIAENLKAWKRTQHRPLH